PSSGALLAVRLGPPPRRSSTPHPLASPASDWPEPMPWGIRTAPAFPPKEAHAASIWPPTLAPGNELAETKGGVPAANHVRWSEICAMLDAPVLTVAMGWAPTGKPGVL